MAEQTDPSDTTSRLHEYHMRRLTQSYGEREHHAAVSVWPYEKIFPKHIARLPTIVGLLTQAPTVSLLPALRGGQVPGGAARLLTDQRASLLERTLLPHRGRRPRAVVGDAARARSRHRRTGDPGARAQCPGARSPPGSAAAAHGSCWCRRSARLTCATTTRSTPSAAASTGASGASCTATRAASGTRRRPQCCSAQRRRRSRSGGTP